MYRVSRVFLRAKSTTSKIKAVADQSIAKRIAQQNKEFERAEKDPHVRALMEEGRVWVDKLLNDPKVKIGPEVKHGWDSTFKKEEESREHSAY